METTREKSSLEKIYNVLEYLRVQLSHNGTACPIQKATIFLTVVLNEGITHGGIKAIQGFHQTTISRNLTELGFFKEKVGDVWEDRGCGLVVSQPCEYNRREYSMFLTTKGKKIAKKVAQLMET